MPTSEDTFWKSKLAAFLHDPPSKALDIFTHTERSEKAMQAAGLGTPEERRAWEHKADHTAASADRFPFPHHSKAKLSCAFDGVRNQFRHPLNGGHCLAFDGPFISVAEGIEREQTTQPVLNDLDFSRIGDSGVEPRRPKIGGWPTCLRTPAFRITASGPTCRWFPPWRVAGATGEVLSPHS
jgi:hypothetical protein